jgi:hypothetical protein
VGYILSLLPFLACPIGMGVMMKFMGGMNHGGHAARRPGAESVPDHEGMAGYGGRPKTLQDEATILASRRAAIVAELQSLGETPTHETPAGRASCCGGGRASRKADLVGGKR